MGNRVLLYYGYKRNRLKGRFNSVKSCLKWVDVNIPENKYKYYFIRTIWR